MALCVTLLADGTLQPTGEPVEACAGYVMQSASEHAAGDLWAQLLAVPSPEIGGTWLVGSFGFVLVMNVVGSMTGAVVKAISSDRD